MTKPKTQELPGMTGKGVDYVLEESLKRKKVTSGDDGQD